MALTPAQFDLNQKRLKEQSHDRYEVNLDLDSGLKLKKFVVCKNVLRVEKTSALYFAKYLASERALFKGKSVMDMGCGTGIQGIVAGLLEAKQMIFSDLSNDAVNNTKENVDRFGLADKSIIYKGDLFEKVNDKVDVIIFNHPFFPTDPIENIPVTMAIFNDGELIHRFLDEAQKHLNEGGFILMPFFLFAGDTNNPEVQAPKHGYQITTKYQIDVDDENIQKGIFSVFELRPKVG